MGLGKLTISICKIEFNMGMLEGRDTQTRLWRVLGLIIYSRLGLGRGTYLTEIRVWGSQNPSPTGFFFWEYNM